MSNLKNTIELSLPMDASFRWSVGTCMERFFAGLGERKLVGVACPRCERVFVPPRMICERCFAETRDWVEVGPAAEVVSFTIANVEVDPTAGGLRDLGEPAILALIKPDGAHSAFVHHVLEAAPGDMRAGMKLEPVWSPEPAGDLSGLLGFRPAGAGG